MSHGAPSTVHPPGGQKYLRRNSTVELAPYMTAKEEKLSRYAMNSWNDVLSFFLDTLW
jgi:hypothetical protein